MRLKREAQKPSQSLYQRNSTAINLLLLAMVVGGGFASVYFTAGTTIPWIVSQAATIGLDLSYLSTISVPAASGLITAAGTGILAVTYGVVNVFASLVSWTFGLGSSKAKALPESDISEVVEHKQQEDLGLGNTISPSLVTLGGSPKVEQEATSPKVVQLQTKVVPLQTKESPKVEEEQLQEEATTSPKV